MINAPDITLETVRLTIFPLTHEQLILYIRPGQLLERSLGLTLHKRTISAALAEALRQTILPAVAAAGDDKYLFSTLWTMVLRDQQVMVGDLCFKGPPNERGEIEIGYGTYDDFRKQGFMTEAVAALTAWAFTHPEVTAIVAETDKENTASHRTLEKNGFKVYRESEWFYWWRREGEM